MINICALEKAGHLRKTRRERVYTLIYCTSGSFSIRIDEELFILKGGDVITITSGQVHCITSDQQACGYVLEFTLGFFCKDDKDIELIFQNGLFCHFDMNQVIRVNQPAMMVQQLELIAQEEASRPYQYLISIHSRIELLLVEINRSKLDRGDEIWKPDALFLKFLEAVRGNFEHNYPLADFAKQLGTTPAKLNELAKLHTGRTAQSVIYGLVASEAKRLLTYENLTVKEVAYKLGFKDPFYFSNFFKKQSQVSPKAYQEQFN